MGSDVVSGCGLHALPSRASLALTDFLSIHVAVALEKSSSLAFGAGVLLC